MRPATTGDVRSPLTKRTKSLLRHLSANSRVRKLTSEQSPAAEPSVHSEEFCENLSDLCDRTTTAEHRLLAAVDHGDDKQVENIRHRLDRLYRQFIYL